MGGGGTEQGTTTQTTEIWDKAKPYVLDHMNRVSQFADAGGYAPYQGDTLAPITPNEWLGYSLGANRALQGNPAMMDAQNQVRSGLGFSGRTGNQFSDQILDRVNATVSPQLAGYNQSQMGMDKAAETMRGNNFGQSIQDQTAYMHMFPQFHSNNMTDLNMLGNIGSQLQQNQQAQLDNATKMYEEEQNLRQQFLSDYMSQIYGVARMGGTSTGTGPVQQSGGMGGALGGAASGASMGATFGPWGAAIGGVAGGLLGGLS